MPSKKVTELAEKIQQTPGASEVVLAVIDTLDSAEKQEGTTDVIQNLEAMIKDQVYTIKFKSEERKAGVEQIDSILQNDSNYRDLTVEIKDLTKKRNVLKKKVKSQNNAISSKIDERTTEIREMKEALADYCSEYHRLTGSDEIELPDGKILRIFMRATVQLPLF